ncbi:MAG: hypothetical protein KKH08_05875, partial [Candidatus Omnitrophica bacterium]|nr:hypothetical protein [Candidatus Omnitrophota bacterium]
SEFRERYPMAKIGLVANLVENEYNLFMSNKDIDHRYIYSPSVKRFGFWNQLKLLLKLSIKSYDICIVLAEDTGYVGYVRSKILAFFSSARKKIVFSMSEIKKHKDRQSNRNLSLCLGSFSADSPIALKKGKNKYSLKVTNLTGQSRVVKCLIDIYSFKNPTHPHGHHCYFVKKFVVDAQSVNVAFSYDWQDVVEFCINKVISKPDELWQGDMRSEGTYRISAVLYDEEEKLLDSLNIYQKLT